MITPVWLPGRPTDFYQLFQHFDKTIFTNLYKTYIRPVLEYGNVVWGPQFVLEQHHVEKVQRRPTRLVYDIRDHAYNNHLEELNLPSLNYRRCRGDMIMIYHLLHHNLNVEPSDLFTLNSSFTTRGHNFKLYKPRTTSRVRSSFFTVGAINDWNSFSPTIVNAPTVNILLRTYWSVAGLLPCMIIS